MRHDLRQEPDAGNPPVRICAGGGAKAPSLPRPASAVGLARNLRTARSLLADVHAEPKGLGFDQLNKTRERRESLTELLRTAILLRVR
jgi:hypothetical protein